MLFGALDLAQPGVGQAELVVDLGRIGIGRRRAFEQVARLGVAALFHPHHAERQVGLGVAGLAVEHPAGVALGVAQALQPLERLGERGQRLDRVRLQAERLGERPLGLRVALLAVERHAQRDVGEGVRGPQRARPFERRDRLGGVADLEPGDAELVAVVGDLRMHPRQRLERLERGRRRVGAEGGAGDRAQHLLGARGEVAGARQEVERGRRVPLLGADPRQVEEGLDRAVALGQRAELGLGVGSAAARQLEHRELHRQVALERPERGGPAQLGERLLLATGQEVEAGEVLARLDQAGRQLERPPELPLRRVEPPAPAQHHAEEVAGQRVVGLGEQPAQPGLGLRQAAGLDQRHHLGEPGCRRRRGGPGGEREEKGLEQDCAQQDGADQHGGEREPAGARRRGAPGGRRERVAHRHGASPSRRFSSRYSSSCRSASSGRPERW